MTLGYHRPVMVDEVLQWLTPGESEVVVDLTLGGGGHSRAILDQLGPEGRLIGVDRDQDALDEALKKLGHDDRFTAVRANFSELYDILFDEGVEFCDKILIDFGVSSHQLDCSTRGFSFRKEARLDMRMDQEQKLCAYEVVNSYECDELAHLFARYGQVRGGRRVARAICSQREERAIETTGELVDLIERTVGNNPRSKKHPATLYFQAIRIEVNGELQEIESVLEQALEVLSPGGRAVYLSYHSLEDRLVKESFRSWSGVCRCPRGLPECRCDAQKRIKILTRQAVKPSEAEVSRNPRARSCRLRAMEKI